MVILIVVLALATFVALAAKFGAKSSQNQEEYERYLRREHGVYMEQPDNRYAHMMNNGR